MPSMVVICLLPAAATGVTQERIGRPSSCTVQAPHSAMPQPNFVPVRPMTSRSTQSSGMSPGTSTVWDVPLMLNVTIVRSSPRCPPSCQHNAAGGRLAPGREPDGAQVGEPGKRRLQVVRSQAGLTPYITGGVPAGAKEGRASTPFAPEADKATGTTALLGHR